MKNKPSGPPWRLVLRVLAGAGAAGMLFLAGATIARSARTAQVNDTLSRLHGQAPEATVSASAIPTVAAPATAIPAARRKAAPAGVSRMGFPDGSAIPAPMGEAAGTGAGNGVFHRTGTEEGMLQNLRELKQINGDLVGWIHIDGVLDLPVVYRDNAWYLNHDFYGNRNPSGTLFLDEYHPLKSGTQNLLIHGHNMKDGSMFALLTHYTSDSFLKAHSLITFSTLWETEIYQVFAVLRVSSRTEDPDYFNYFSHPVFAAEADCREYLAELQRRAVQRLDLPADPGKALLELSTCVGDDRIVVAAQRIL